MSSRNHPPARRLLRVSGLIYDTIGELIQTPPGAVRRIVSGLIYYAVCELLHTATGVDRLVVISDLICDAVAERPRTHSR